MKLIVVIDDDNGMMFHHRRQSQDAVLRENILAMAKDSALWINPYTRGQFAEVPNYVHISKHPMEEAREGEFCFAEDMDIRSCEEKIEELIIFRWNRRYPGDVKFELDLKNWNLKETSGFQGKSHEKITKEVYVR